MSDLTSLSHPPPSSRILDGFAEVDYLDSFRLAKRTDADIDTIARKVFELPGWALGLMRLRNRIVRMFGWKADDESMADGRGNEGVRMFPVVSRNEDEIVMGLEDKHLDFRVSVMADRVDGFLFVTTAVHIHNRLGRAYFSVIKPFHYLIVGSLTRNLRQLT